MKKELFKEKLKLEEVELEDEKSFIKISCPSCSSDIPAENININDKIAKCNSCAAVFPFQKDLDVFSNTKSKGSKDILRPEGVDIYNFKDNHEIVITQPLTAFEYIILYVMLFSLFVLFVLSMEIGLSFIYFVGTSLSLLAYLFSLFKRDHHKVFIEIDRTSLAIKWRPKKMISDKSFSLKDIKQLYVKGGQLHMIVDGLEGSKHIKILSFSSSTTITYFLEQEIERFLGLKDQTILGEDQ